MDVYKKQSKGFVQQIGIWFLLSCLANISWIFAWHYRIVWLSVLIIIAVLVIQIILANKVKIGHKIWSWRDKLFIQVLFSLYVGWLSVATIANITSWLVNIGWSMRGMSDLFWTCLVIVVATVLALVSLWKKYDIVYASVILRAFLGILLKRISIDPVYAMPILWTLGISMFVISLGMGYKFAMWKKN